MYFCILHTNFEALSQVKFYLHKRGDLKNNLPIVLKYTFGRGQRFEYYTGLHANVSWYIEKYYAKKGGKPIKENAPDAESLNSKLEGFRSNVSAIERVALANKTPLSSGYFRIELDKIYKPNKLNQEQKAMPVTFMQVFDSYIERCKTSINENA